MSEQTQYVVRTQSDRAYQYGLGEVVIPGVTLFRDGNYDLSREEVDAKLLRLTTPKKAH
jgi:hypothetical protein